MELRRLFVLGFVTLLASCITSTSARRMRRPLAVQQATSHLSLAAVQRQQQQLSPQPLSATFSELQPTISASWVPSITASTRTLEVPVSGIPGTPLKQQDMSRITYRVTFTRRPVWLLKGTVTIAPTAFSGSDADFQEIPIQQPAISLQQASDTQAMPGDRIRCSSLRITRPSSPVTCTFAAPIFSLDTPPAGTAQAVIQLPDGGPAITTPAAAYDFATVVTSPPPQGRFASSGAAAQFLVANMRQRAVTATVSNYFEPGAGHVIPSGVEGTQPPANSELADTQTFTYSALFGDLPRDKCGQSLKVALSATVESTSDGQPPQTVMTTVDLVLVGCNAPPGNQFQSGPGGCSSSPAGGGLYVPAAPLPQTPPPSVAAEAASQAPDEDLFMDIRPPPGVFVAAAGSTLCGPSNAVCSPEETCLDSWLCCPRGSTRCGNGCSGIGSVCIQGKVMPPGSFACGTDNACSADQSCLEGKCCAANQPACGGSCCNQEAGEVCLLNQCVARGSSACGSNVCAPGQACASPDNICCGPGESTCGGRCCGAGSQCLQGQCVAAGSSTCAGGLICAPGTFCSGGMLCCTVGSEYCGGSCCGSGHQCMNNQCVPNGASTCGGAICGPGQTCQGNGQCCDNGHSGCGGSCCNTGAGMQCMNNQCVPHGTSSCGTTTCPVGTHCGDPGRSLCCANDARACNGNCCGPGLTCSYTGQCVAWGAEGADRGYMHQPYEQHNHGYYNRGFAYGRKLF